MRICDHAKRRMLLRGATEEEVVETIREGRWEPVKMDRLRAKRRLVFNAPTPINGKYFKFKTIETVFMEKPGEIVVITVKVYYFNEEGM